MLREISLRIEKISDMQNKLKASEEKYKTLENNLSEGERKSKERSDTLERNLEQLTLMYHQLTSRESNLKVERKVSERKVQRLTEKVNVLDKETKEYKDQIEKLKYESEKMYAELRDLREFKEKSINEQFLSPRNHIKKTIKGGDYLNSRKTIQYVAEPIFKEKSEESLNS